MTRTKVLLIMAAVVTFAAGAAVGLSFSRAQHGPHGPSWLAAELGLTGRQKEQMREIWSEVMSKTFRDRWEQRRIIAEERDQAIVDLLTEEQRSRYDAILQEYTRKREEMEQQREQAFKEAIERTKQVLTPEQATKYEELLKKRPERGPGDRHGDRRGPPPPWGGKPPEDQEDHKPSPPPHGEE
jgi:Spy/CpxP family protein refolding chaperone